MTRTKLVARAALSEPVVQVEVSGSRSSLAELARSLTQDSVSMSEGDADQFYNVTLKEVRVQVRPGERVLLRVDVEADRLHIAGDDDLLAILSANIADFAREGAVGEHLHVEYFPGHFFLDPQSAPLIITLWAE